MSEGPTPYHILATCPRELGSVLVGELAGLGAAGVREGHRIVEADVDLAGMYRACLWLRTASRILWQLKVVPATRSEMVFDQVRRMPWPDWFAVDRSYKVEASTAGNVPSPLPSDEVLKRVRQGIDRSFEHTVGRRPRVDRHEPRVVVVAFLEKGRLSLSLDLTGKSAHKRGYRLEGHPAPLKETLAAGILELAGYDGQGPLLDPFCGSGTLAIEAASLALRKAPLIHRSRGEFAFEWLLAGWDRNLWREVQDTARRDRLPAPPAPIFAADIDPGHVDLARRTALRARVEKDIHFQVQDFFETTAPAERGLLVANLPYGERLGLDGAPADEVYARIGTVLKHRFPGWTAALLVPEQAPWPRIGLRPRRRIPLLNGDIPVKLLLFELYR